MSGRVAGKIALVTGAASGLGLASAMKLSSEGATCVGFCEIRVTARKPESSAQRRHTRRRRGQKG